MRAVVRQLKQRAMARFNRDTATQGNTSKKGEKKQS
jgi:hypothetical protein